MYQNVIWLWNVFHYKNSLNYHWFNRHKQWSIGSNCSLQRLCLKLKTPHACLFFPYLLKADLNATLHCIAMSTRNICNADKTLYRDRSRVVEKMKSTLCHALPVSWIHRYSWRFECNEAWHWDMPFIGHYEESSALTITIIKDEQNYVYINGKYVFKNRK